MLQDNLIMLRNMYGMSQEEIAVKIGISRQAYAKWESGATVPDIEKCKRLADFYDVTIDSLLKTAAEDNLVCVGFRNLQLLCNFVHSDELLFHSIPPF